MELTKTEKEDLQALTKHKGFKVFERLYQDKKTELLEQFMWENLWDEQVLLRINSTQNLVKWMKILIDTAKTRTVKKVDTVEDLR